MISELAQNESRTLLTKAYWTKEFRVVDKEGSTLCSSRWHEDGERLDGVRDGFLMYGLDDARNDVFLFETVALMEVATDSDVAKANERGPTKITIIPPLRR